MQSPCLQCRREQPGRAHLGCHGHCEDYIGYKLRKEELDRKINSARNFEYLLDRHNGRRR